MDSTDQTTASAKDDTKEALQWLAVLSTIAAGGTYLFYKGQLSTVTEWIAHHRWAFAIGKILLSLSHHHI